MSVDITTDPSKSAGRREDVDGRHVMLIWQDGSISHHNLPSNSLWQGGKPDRVV